MTTSIVSKISPQLYIKIVQKLKLEHCIICNFLLQLSHIEVEMTNMTKVSAISV